VEQISADFRESLVDDFNGEASVDCSNGTRQLSSPGGTGRLIVVSNRVAVPTAGSNQAGGLAVAVRSLLRERPGVWFGWSGKTSEGERLGTTTIERDNLTYVLTDLSKNDYSEYYNGFANRVLWPILHYRLDLAEFLRRDLSGYRRVNEHFANQLHRLLRDDDVVWVHDYHLIPLARMLRERGHRNRIGFFLHIPCPPPEILTALPHHESLIPLLGDYDLVGFQTAADANNCARYFEHECGYRALGGLRFQTPERPTKVGVFPIGIETEVFNRIARRSVRSPMVRNVVDSLAGRAMIIGVDRLDYSKGLAQRLDAYEQFLAVNPAWRNQVTYLQITPKSRSEISEYVDMERVVNTEAGRINGTYGEAAWTPIRYVNQAYSRQVLAGLYRASRVALVTPLRDGMNLVAKEYIAAQDPEDPGVLILSRFAGAAEECSAALLVNPYDPERVAGSIARALSMPLAERKERHEALYRAVARNDVNAWGERFLDALTGAAARTAIRPALPVESGIHVGFAQ
jgi:trehalose 6-phosphate synthase